MSQPSGDSTCRGGVVEITVTAIKVILPDRFDEAIVSCSSRQGNSVLFGLEGKPFRAARVTEAQDLANPSLAKIARGLLSMSEDGSDRLGCRGDLVCGTAHLEASMKDSTTGRERPGADGPITQLLGSGALGKFLVGIGCLPNLVGTLDGLFLPLVRLGLRARF